tara:strand:+ start:1037 stop:1147 length:111 start_codon:yes stop_codon:yes gene_type:complete
MFIIEVIVLDIDMSIKKYDESDFIVLGGSVRLYWIA